MLLLLLVLFCSIAKAKLPFRLFCLPFSISVSRVMHKSGKRRNISNDCNVNMTQRFIFHACLSSIPFPE